MPGVRDPLTETDQRAVVLREAGRGHEVADRTVSQAGKDLGREQLRVRFVAGSVADGELVGGVLGSPPLCGASAVRWVALF